MKNIFFVTLIMAFLIAGCTASGHKSQTWQPKSAKKMKSGRNR